MAFDLSSARPVSQPSGGFNLSTAIPVEMPPTAAKPQESGFLDTAAGIGEAALAIGTGIPAQVASGFSGLAGGDIPATQEALTYAPRTQEGQEALQSVGEAAEFVGETISRIPAGLKGLFDLATGEDLDTAARSVEEIKTRGASKVLGDYVADVTGSPELATAVALTPELASTLVPAFKLKSMQNSAMLQAIEQGSDKALNYLARGSKAVKSKAIKKARDLGVLDDATTKLIKGSSAEDKKSVLSMIKTAKRGLTDKKAQYLDRTYDEAGKALKTRIDTLDNTLDEYGKRIGELTRNLDGDVSLDNAVTNFTNKLYDDLSVRFVQKDGKFTPSFKGSAIEDNATAKRVVSRLVERIQNPKMNNPNYAHRALKQYIDDQVNYGKVGEGLTGKADNIVKGFRSDINQTLQEAIPKYGELNAVYSKAANLKNAISDSIGRKVNLKDSRAMGTAARALGNNTQKRGNMINALNEIEDFTKSLGKEQKGDVMTQFIIADELDNLLGGQAATGLKRQSGGAAAVETAQAIAEPRSLVSKAGKLLSKEVDTAQKLDLYEKAVKDMLRGQ